MELPEKSHVYKIIKSEFKPHQSIFENFKRVCRRLKYDSMPYSFVSQWISLLQETKQILNGKEHGYKERLLLSYIIGWKNLREKAISYNLEIEDYKLLGKNPRYGYKLKFNVDWEFIGLDLMDFYHGKKRPIFFTEPFSSQTSESKYLYSHSQTFFINPNLLIIKTDHSIQKSTQTFLLLLEINFSEWNCQIRDKFPIQNQESHFETIVIDEENEKRFVLFKYSPQQRPFFNPIGFALDQMRLRLNNNGSEHLIYHFEINSENKFTIQNGPIKFHTRRQNSDLCLRLCNNKLYSLDRPNIEFENLQVATIGDYVYLEWEKDENEHVYRASKKVTFQIDDKKLVRHLMSNIQTYRWHKNRCYINVPFAGTLSQTCYFDLDTQQFGKLDFLCQSSENLMRLVGCEFRSPENHQIDENGVLSVRSDEAIYRFPLRSPESLQNLIWFKVRRRALWEDDQFYKQTLKQLPLNSDLQPFSIRD